MNQVGNYEVKKFSKWRKNISVFTHESWRKHAVHVFLELDVTKARKILKDYKKINRSSISFTGWIAKCLAETLKVHPDLNCYRQGRNKIVVFEDVDVSIAVERFVDGEPYPLGIIVRKANEKNVKEITKEIRAAQKKAVEGSEQVLSDKKTLSFTERFALNAPTFLQKIVVHFIRLNGILKKKYMGTVGVTSVGMLGRISGGIIPQGGNNNIILVVCGINKKPMFLKDKIIPREMLSVTISVDHDLIDGGPLIRFIDTLSEFIESGFCLDELRK